MEEKETGSTISYGEKSDRAYQITQLPFPTFWGGEAYSIITPDGARGDALSTALMVMGLEKSIAFWKLNPDFGVVMCTTSGDIYCSSDLKEQFFPEDNKEVTYFEEA